MEDLEFENTLIEKEYPVIALRGKVLFPNTYLNFDIGRQVSIQAVDCAADSDSLILISSQKNAFIDNPKVKDLNKVCTLAKIKQIMRLPNGNIKLNVEALERMKITSFNKESKFFKANAVSYPYLTDGTEEEIEAYFRTAKNAFYEYTLFDKRITKDMLYTISELKEPNIFMDNAISVATFKESDAQEFLETTNTIDRLKKFQSLFTKELEILKIEKKISASVRESIDQSQKEYYLREQLKAIHSELGDDDELNNELLESIKAKKLPKEIEEKALKEIKRLDKINPSSPDYSIILNYLDWIKELPFNDHSVDT